MISTGRGGGGTRDLGEEKENNTGKKDCGTGYRKVPRSMDLVHVLIVRQNGEIICKHLRGARRRLRAIGFVISPVPKCEGSPPRG
jgi:hypothetical protein